MRTRMVGLMLVGWLAGCASAEKKEPAPPTGEDFVPVRSFDFGGDKLVKLEVYVPTSEIVAAREVRDVTIRYKASGEVSWTVHAPSGADPVHAGRAEQGTIFWRPSQPGTFLVIWQSTGGGDVHVEMEVDSPYAAHWVF